MTKKDTIAASGQRVAGNLERKKAANDTADAAFHRSLFIRMAVDMSWQLALVVIVPILGGHMLDQHYGKTPWFTLGGLAVAAIGVFGVLSKVVAEADQRIGNIKPKGTK